MTVRRARYTRTRAPHTSVSTLGRFPSTHDAPGEPHTSSMNGSHIDFYSCFRLTRCVPSSETATLSTLSAAFPSHYMACQSSDGRQSASMMMVMKLPIDLPNDGLDFAYSITFLADGQYVVEGGFEGKIRCWRVDDGREAGKLMKTGDVDVLSLAVTRDGKWIVSGGDEGRVAVWDTETHCKVCRFKAHPLFPIKAVDMSPDGTRRTVPNGNA